MWAKWKRFYNRAKSANAALSLFERAWRLCAIVFGSAVLAWASRTWDWYWNTFSWAGVAFAFLVSCVGLALAFFLTGLGMYLWRGKQPPLAASPSIAPSLPEPIAQSESLVPLHMEIPHVRTSVYFDQLEDEGLIRLTLEFLNASADEISLESVKGHLSYSGNEKELHQVIWLDERKPPRAKSFDDLPITFQQSPPSWVSHFLLELARNGNPFSIKFHLHTKAKVLATGEVVELRPWEGVSCQTKGLPVVTGRIISLTGMSSR